MNDAGFFLSTVTIWRAGFMNVAGFVLSMFCGADEELSSDAVGEFCCDWVSVLSAAAVFTLDDDDA